MKRIVIGEFESMKKIEKLLISGKDEFGIYSDFEAVSQLDIEKLNLDEIVIYLEELKTFNARHEMIKKYQDVAILFLAKKEVRRYRDFFENEGYSTRIKMDPGHEKSTDEKRKSQVYSPQVILFTGRFDIAVKTAFALGQVSSLKCAFWDLDAVNGFTQLRVKLDRNQDWVYLNEQIRDGHTGAMTQLGNLFLAPVVHGTDLNQLNLENWIDDCRRRYDIQFIYCHMGESDVVMRLLPSIQKLVVASEVTYEHLVSADRWLTVCGAQEKGSILGVESKKKKMNYLGIYQWITADVLGILKHTEICDSDIRKRWICLHDMQGREKKAYLKVLRALAVIRG